MTTVLLAIAGGAGALTRAEVGRALATRRPDAPWGTRVVNLLGTAALALLLALDVGAEVATVVGTGFLGGFTTFSTWMLDADQRGGRGRWLEVVGQLAVAGAVVAAVRVVA